MKIKMSLFVFLAIGMSIACGIDIANAVTFTTDTLIDSGDSTYDGQDIVVDGCILTVNSEHSFNSLTVTNGGIVTHSAGETGFDLTTTGDLTVDQGGLISADGRGYGYASGPGAGSNDNSRGSGGGYGGAGGNSSHVSGGSTYGSLTEPVDLGSGGGLANYGGIGGAGGVPFVSQSTER